MIRTDQVSVLEIESIELIACLFGVVHVVVDHECGALRVIGDTLADLAIDAEKKSKRVNGGQYGVPG